MKTTKIVIAFVTALLLIGLLAACGSKDEGKITGKWIIEWGEIGNMFGEADEFSVSLSEVGIPDEDVDEDFDEYFDMYIESSKSIVLNLASSGVETYVELELSLDEDGRKMRMSYEGIELFNVEYFIDGNSLIVTNAEGFKTFFRRYGSIAESKTAASATLPVTFTAYGNSYTIEEYRGTDSYSSSPFIVLGGSGFDTFLEKKDGNFYPPFYLVITASDGTKHDLKMVRVGDTDYLIAFIYPYSTPTAVSMMFVNAETAEVIVEFNIEDVPPSQS